MHSFIFGSSTFGGHEMMAAMIIREISDASGAVRVIAPSIQINQLRERLPQGIDYVLLSHRSRRFELLCGKLNPYYLSAMLEIQKLIKGSTSITVVNGGITANHTLTLATAQAAKLESIPAMIYYPMLHNSDEMSLKGVRSFNYHAAQRRIFNSFNLFVTIDDIWRQRLIALTRRPIDVKLIHNLIDIEPILQPVALETRGPVRFCFVGRFDCYQKGLDLLIDTLRQLRDSPTLAPMQWVFIGSGPDELMLRNACAHLATDRLSFEFHSWQRNPIELIRRCHALVLPSRLEGVPTVVAEALVLRLPVFAYAIAGAHLLLPKNSLIRPFDTAAMANALAYFASQFSTASKSAESSPYLDMLLNRSRFRDEVLFVYTVDSGKTHDF
jgi:glycosyltransferase involved in cell wall biosynthesis